MQLKTVSTALALAAFIVTPALAQKYAERTQLPDRGLFDESGGRFVDADADMQLEFGLPIDAPRHLRAH